jgi:cytochrome c peroxidase
MQLKHFVFVLTLGAATGCGNKQDETPAAPVAAAPAPLTGPAALVAKAKALFAVLPAVMESPSHPITDAKVALGRQLYFEKRLSKNHDLSCNSCHALDAYGADTRPGSKTSQGHKGQFGGRNSPTVYNAALHVAQFWDGRAADVEAQAKGPILNPVEMAMPNEAAVITMLKSIPDYAPMFTAAFPGAADAITYDNMAEAIGAFERKLTTPAPFDRFVGGDATALNEQQQRGLSLFIDGGCIACHMGVGLGGALYQKLGLLKPYPSQDQGRFDVTKSEADRLMFKVPSLRNIEHTAPYLHDGSIATLEEAVKMMAEYQTAKGTLNAVETQELVAFLHSLSGALPTDYIREPTALASGPTTPKADPN